MVSRQISSTVKKIAFGLTSIAVCAVLLVVIRYYTESQDQEQASLMPVRLSAWVVDWSLQSGLQDAAAIADQLSSLHWFAVYFDEQDKLTFGPDGSDAYEEFKQLVVQEQLPSYITVVNDVWLTNGRAVQKDADLISRIVASSASREQHIEHLMSILAITGADGLELDYEQIRDSDWDGMIALIDELSKQLQASGKKLRIILEPKAPVERLRLPEGPEYVMMAYNLYGSHSGPGPKADHAFLQQLAARMELVPGEAVIALSLGGFSWGSDGKIRSLTEQQAEVLAEQHAVQIVRDTGSSAQFYTYMDAGGELQTVWFADHITIEQWIQTLRNVGVHHVALWRLGELGDGTIRYASSMMTDD